jgi:ABC-type glycerol-3-phosphate transport system substrate-binding protein
MSTPRARSSTGFGAMLVNEKGDVTVKSDAVRQALEFYKKLQQFLPPEVAAWDDASNNKFLVSGQASLIMNPPSAWAVAKRDAPKVAELCWTHGFAAGPKGRFAPFVPYFWSIWNFSKNQAAAKSLLRHLSTEPVVESMVVASGGYDLPSFEKFTTFKVWQEEGPPKGTLYHYPNPLQSPDPVGRRRAGAARHRRAHLHPGDDDPDGGALLQGRAAREDAGLGGGELEGFMRN